MRPQGRSAACRGRIGSEAALLELIRTSGLAGDRTVAHGFTTRHGGASVGPFATLNLAMKPAESAEAVAENWRRVARALSPGLDPASVALVSQVHGDRVIEATAGAGPGATLGEADAMWTSKPGVVLGIRVADCAPILVASPGGVAAIHAGWRGAAAGVVEQAVRALANGTGDAPAQMIASVGPCISAERFEVGPEVVEAIAATGITGVATPGPSGRPHLDLRRVVALQLRRAGVGTVEHADLCTASDARFWSHRRDGEPSGRTAGVIARVAR